jgi:hypothetical protein
MSLAAFPDGIDGLHKIDEWRDFVSMLLRSKTGTVPSADEIASPPQEIQDDALFAKACGADTGKLPIAMLGGKPLDQSQLKMYLKRCYTPLQTYFEVLRWNEGDECYPHELDSFKANPKILFAPEPVELAWAPCRASFHALLETTLSEAWGEWNLEENEEFAIGTVNSTRILRHVVIYTRKTG